MAVTHLAAPWSKTPYVVTKDFAVADRETGTYDVYTLPANTIVLDCRVLVTTAGTGSGTITVGDAGSAARYMTAAVVSSPGFVTANGAKFGYASETLVYATVATDTINAGFSVILTLADAS